MCSTYDNSWDCRRDKPAANEKKKMDDIYRHHEESVKAQLRLPAKKNMTTTRPQSSSAATQSFNNLDANDSSMIPTKPSLSSTRTTTTTTTTTTTLKALNIVFQQDILPWDDAVALGSTCKEFYQFYKENQQKILTPLLKQLEELLVTTQSQCCFTDHDDDDDDDGDYYRGDGMIETTPRPCQKSLLLGLQEKASTASTGTTTCGSIPPPVVIREGEDVVHDDDDDEYCYFPFLDLDPQQLMEYNDDNNHSITTTSTPILHRHYLLTPSSYRLVTIMIVLCLIWYQIS